eukprot:5866457-Pyramimonas_sp.AAC.1
MEKTEKSMAELTVELNKSFEFDKITEAGADLAPLSGAGYVGLKNLGNSCYMNSVMQVGGPSRRARFNTCGVARAPATVVLRRLRQAAGGWSSQLLSAGPCAL